MLSEASSPVTENWMAGVALENSLPSAHSNSFSTAIVLLRSVVWIWHVCSLDAPVIGVLWAVFLSSSLHAVIRPVEMAVLGLAIWLVYVADRMLDVWLGRSSERLQARHLFYRRHWLAFSILFVVALGGALGLSFGAMDARLLREDSILLLAVGLYFCGVHFGPQAVRVLLPKRMAVAAIFAAGTLIPAHVHGVWGRPALLEGLALGGLCWLNCSAIERWENREGEVAADARRNFFPPYTVTPGVALGLAMLGAAMSFFLWNHSFIEDHAVYAACILSCVALALVHLKRAQLPADVLRLLADLALFTPLLLLPFGGSW